MKSGTDLLGRHLLMGAQGNDGKRTSRNRHTDGGRCKSHNRTDESDSASFNETASIMTGDRVTSPRDRLDGRPHSGHDVTCIPS